MSSRWIWLWPLSLAGLLALAAGDRARAQEPEKGGPKAKNEPRTIKDQLTGTEPRDRVRILAPSKSYQHDLVKGKTYLIDLASEEFDAYLRLEDGKGTQVAADDDSGGNLNAQVSYTPKETAAYRFFVTGFGKGTRGKFVLTIREIAVRKAKASDVKLEGEGPTTIKDEVTADDGIDERGRPYKAFALTTQAAKSYRLHLRGLPDAELRLLDAKGQVLRRSHGGDKKEVALTFQPKTDGTYQLLVRSGRSGKTGEFSLTITPGEPQQIKVADLDAGKPDKIKGELTEQDGTDAEGKYCRVYKFEAEAGKEYRFEARGKADPMLRLQDDKGKALQQEDYGDAGYSHLSFRPSKTGTYRLVVASARPDRTGEFVLSGGDRLKQAVAFPIGKEASTLKGQLSLDDELDNMARPRKSHVFQGEAGKIYIFKASGTFIPALGVERIVDKAPKDFKQFPFQIVSAPSQGHIYVSVKATDKYYLTVASAPGQKGGGYTLTATVLATRLAQVTPTPKFQELKVKAATISGVLTPQDSLNANGQPYHVVKLQTEPNKAYDIKLTAQQPGMGMPQQLRLEGEKREMVRLGQYGPNNLGLVYAATKKMAGRLVILGYQNQRMPYTLTVTEMEYTPPKQKVEKLVIAVKGGKMTGINSQMNKNDELGSQVGYQRIYEFEGQGGKIYTFNVFGNFNPALGLEFVGEPNGKDGAEPPFRLLPNTSGQHISVALKASGTYRLSVSTLPGQASNFNLSASATDSKPAQVTSLPKFRNMILKVAKHSGELTDKDGINSNGQPYQLIALKTEPKKVYDMRVVPQKPGFNTPQLRLEGLKGEVIQYAQFGSGLIYRSTKAAEYRIAVIGYLGQKLPYNLTITESDDTTKVKKLVVAPGKPTTDMDQLTLADPLGNIGKNHKLYTFEAKAGKSYQIDLHSKAFDAYLYLQDSSGKVLAANDDAFPGKSLDSRIVWKMTKSGTYQILATGLHPNQVGPYTLTVQELGAAPPPPPFKGPKDKLPPEVK